MEITLVVLAAGQSARYGKLKQLDQFGPHGESLMDYSVHDAHRAGLSRVVVVTREEILPSVRAHVKRYQDLIAVDIAVQQTSLPHSFTDRARRHKPWGTAHAVLSAESLVSGPFIVVNADDFYGRTAHEQMGAYLRNCDPTDPTFAMVPFTLSTTLSPHGGVSRGVCTVGGGSVTEIIEIVDLRRNRDGVTGFTLDGQNKSFEGREPVSMNYWGFTPAIFPLLAAEFERFVATAEADAEFPISDTVNTMLRERRARLKMVDESEEWFGVTHPNDKFWVVAGFADLTAAGIYSILLFLTCN